MAVLDLGKVVGSDGIDANLPSGEEGQILQYQAGEWKAADVIGQIGIILDTINGEVT